MNFQFLLFNSLKVEIVFFFNLLFVQFFFFQFFNQFIEINQESIFQESFVKYQ